MSCYYFAYGANLNRRSMRHRCPVAVPMGAYRLAGHRLVFRSVADIEPAREEAVHGVLWRITDECLQSLDLFEGYPYVYDHRFFRLDDGTAVLFYKMNATDYELPASRYYDILREGYEDFGLPIAGLTRAHAYTEAYVVA